MLGIGWGTGKKEPGKNSQVIRAGVFVSGEPVTLKSSVLRRRAELGKKPVTVLVGFKNAAGGKMLQYSRRVAIGDARALPWVLEKIEACLAEIDGTVVLLDGE